MLSATSSAKYVRSGVKGREQLGIENPFPGLRPFEEEDAPWFKGRTSQITELLRRLAENRFLGVIGVSGSGKSSLVRAGLIPALRQGFIINAGTSWKIALMRPGKSPIQTLAKHLDSALGEVAGREEMLRKGSRGLLSIAQGLVIDETAPYVENLLVVVDQFEEIFRYKDLTNTDCEDSPLRAIQEADAFVSLLLTALADDRIYIVVTMRSDYLGDCAQFPGLSERINNGQYLVPALNRREKRKIIEEPILAMGATIAEPLVQRLISDVGSEPDRLPILQHALRQIWLQWVRRAVPESAVDINDYVAVDGFDGAMNKHADKAFKDLPSDEHRNIARKLFQRITLGRAGNKAPTRRPTELWDIFSVSGASNDLSRQEMVREVIRHYRSSDISFLTSPELGDFKEGDLEESAIIDITHESLCLLWTRLAKWVDAEVKAAWWYQRITQSALLQSARKDGIRESLPDYDLQEVIRDYLPEHGEALDAWTEAWSTRYNDNFKVVRQHVEYSRREQSRKQAEAEKARIRQARSRIWKLAGPWIVLCVISAGALLYGLLRQETNLNDASYLEHRSEAFQAELGNYTQELAALFKVASFKTKLIEDNSVVSDWEAFERITRPLAMANADETGLVGRAFRVSVTADGKHAIATPPRPRGSNVLAPPIAFDIEKNDALLHKDSLFPGDLEKSIAAVSDSGRYAVSTCDAHGRAKLYASPDWKEAKLALVCTGDAVFVQDALTGAGGSRDEQVRHDAERNKGLVAIQEMTKHAGSRVQVIVISDSDRTPLMDQVYSGDPESIAMSADGKFIAIADREKRAVQLYAVRDGSPAKPKLLISIAGVAVTFPLAFSLKSKYFAAGKDDGSVFLYDLAGRKAITGKKNAKIPGHVTAVAFSPDENLLAIGGDAQNITLRVVDMDKDRILWSDYFGRPVLSLAFSPGAGEFLGIGVGENTARVFDSKTGFEQVRLTQNGAVYSVAFDPSAKYLVSGANDGTVRVSPTQNAEPQQRIETRCFARAAILGPAEAIADCKAKDELSPFAAKMDHKEVGVYLFPWGFKFEDKHWVPSHSKEPVPLQRWSGRGRADMPPCQIALASNGSLAASACGSEVEVSEIHMAGESTNNGAYLKLNPLEIVHVDTSKLKYIEPPDINLPDQCPGSYITSLSIAGNAKSLAVGDDCGRLFFSRWEPASNSWLPLTASKFKAGDYGTVQEGRPPAITTLRFNADGARVAAGISNGQLWLFDGPDRDAAPLIRYDKDEQTTDLNFSPNSRLLARATGTTVRVIALPPIKQKGEIDGSVPVENYPPLAFHDIIRTLSFSDDGRYLSVIGVKGDVKVYPTRSLPQKRTFIEWLERTFVSTYNVVKPPISSVEYFKLRDSRNAPLAIYDVRLLAEGHLEVLGDNKRVWAESEESGEQVLALSEHDLNLENRATKICKSLGDDLPDAGISRAAVCLSMPVVISWLFWSSLAKQLRFAV